MSSRLNSEFAEFYNNSGKDAVNYVLTGHPDKLGSLKDLLDLHEIQYASAQPGNIKGYNASKGKNVTLKTDKNSLVVSTDQPKGKMVKVLMEPATKLSDSLTYDITAWSLPYAYGVEAISTNRSVPVNAGIQAKTAQNINRSEMQQHTSPIGTA